MCIASPPSCASAEPATIRNRAALADQSDSFVTDSTKQTCESLAAEAGDAQVTAPIRRARLVRALLTPPVMKVPAYEDSASLAKRTSHANIQDYTNCFCRELLDQPRARRARSDDQHKHNARQFWFRFEFRQPARICRLCLFAPRPQHIRLSRSFSRVRAAGDRENQRKKV